MQDVEMQNPKMSEAFSLLLQHLNFQLLAILHFFLLLTRLHLGHSPITITSDTFDILSYIPTFDLWPLTYWRAGTFSCQYLRVKWNHTQRNDKYHLPPLVKPTFRRMMKDINAKISAILPHPECNILIDIKRSSIIYEVLVLYKM